MDLKERSKRVDEREGGLFESRRKLVGSAILIAVPLAVPIGFLIGVVMICYVKFVPERIQEKIGSTVSRATNEGKFFFIVRHERRRFRAFLRQTGIPRAHRKYWESVLHSRLRVRWFASGYNTRAELFSEVTDTLVNEAKNRPLALPRS